MGHHQQMQHKQHQSSEMHRTATHVFVLVFLFVFSLRASSMRSGKVGVNYGQLGNDLLSPQQSVNLIRSLNATSVKIYDANHSILHALADTGLTVSIMLPNQLIYNVSYNQSIADNWVSTNVLPFYPTTRIRYLLVGNEILSLPDKTTIARLVPAMKSLHTSLRLFKLRKIEVGTTIAMDALSASFPPSNGTFRHDLLPVLVPMLRFIRRTNSFFFMDIYPFFAWSSASSQIPLDYCLLNPTNFTYTDPVSHLTYTNLLDQMLDSVFFAMSRLGFPKTRIVVAETGWPNSGDPDQMGANVHNAAVYNRNVVRKFLHGGYTPARPKSRIPVYIFSLYNENQKPGPGTERKFGMRFPNGSEIYGIDLSGRRKMSEFKPLPPPLNNGPYKGKLWCTVTKGANVTAVKEAVAWACGVVKKGTCGEIEKKGRCYSGGDLLMQATFVFSSYWFQFRPVGGGCYFNGVAVQTTFDPSGGICRVPSVNPSQQ